MFKRKLTPADIFLILINLIPLVGVWFMDWEPRQMFLIYCVETIIIGFYTVIKMAVAGLYKGSDDWTTEGGGRSKQPFWFFILFFIVHYGIFVFVQVNIFAGVSGWADDGLGFNFFTKIPSLLTDYSKLVLYIFIGMYGVKMFADFIASGAYKNISLMHLMFQPYGRILIQQFVVILGSMFLTFNAGKIFMLIFVAVKIYAEVFLNFERLLAISERKALKDKEDNQVNKSEF